MIQRLTSEKQRQERIVNKERNDNILKRLEALENRLKTIERSLKEEIV
jgi:hypothetical protein